MASSPTPSLLPGQSPPLVSITSFDKGGIIIIVTALCLALSLTSLLIRAYVRYEFSRQPVAWDDGFVVLAFIFSIFQSALVFREVKLGLGRKENLITQSDLVQIQKDEYADQILYICSVWITKLSIIFLFIRLSPKRGHVLAAKVDTAIAAITAVVAILVVALRCDLSHPWIHINSHDAQCTGLFARWQVVAAFDIATETLLFATSIYLLYALQMPLAKRGAIMFSFSTRLPLIVPIVLRLHYLSEAFDSPNYTLQVTWASICQQVEICYAIIAATIPCLKPFMSAMATNYGAPAEGPRTKIGTYARSEHNSSSRRKEDASGYNLASFKSGEGSGQRSRTLSEKRDGDVDGVYDGLRADNSQGAGTTWGHKANISSSAPRKLGSIESGDSREHIIRKDVEYVVEYEGNAGGHYKGPEVL